MMNGIFNYHSWLLMNWSQGVLPTAAILVVLLPLVYHGLDILPAVIFLQLPLYLVHQYEEHARGEFNTYLQQVLGREVLSDGDIFLINVLLVWVLILTALYLAVYVDPALGLSAGYLSLLNGISHVAMMAVRGNANPGAWSSLFPLVPGGGAAVWVITQATAGTGLQDHKPGCRRGAGGVHCHPGQGRLENSLDIRLAFWRLRRMFCLKRIRKLQ